MAEYKDRSLLEISYSSYTSLEHSSREKLCDTLDSRHSGDSGVSTLSASHQPFSLRQKPAETSVRPVTAPAVQVTSAPNLRFLKDPPPATGSGVEDRDGHLNISLNSPDKIVLKVGGPPDRSPPASPYKSATSSPVKPPAMPSLFNATVNSSGNRGSVYMNVPGHHDHSAPPCRTDVPATGEDYEQDLEDVQPPMHPYVNISQDLVKGSKLILLFPVFCLLCCF